MTDNPYQLMAKQFVDMWQKQLADMMVDEQFVANIIDLMHQQGGLPHANPATPNTPSPSAPTANPAPAPDATGAAVGQLERRLASAEARIAELEREMAALRRERVDAASKRPATRRKS